MNNTDIIDCVFPFLHHNTSASTFKQLCLVNKCFNKEFKDMDIVIMFDKWFYNSASSHFWKTSKTEFKDYMRKKNNFEFQIILGRYNDYSLHDVKFAINNGIGFLSIDSGNCKHLECDYDEFEDNPEEFDDESSDFFDRTIRTYPNIQSCKMMIEIIDDIVR